MQAPSDEITGNSARSFLSNARISLTPTSYGTLENEISTGSKRSPTMTSKSTAEGVIAQPDPTSLISPQPTGLSGQGTPEPAPSAIVAVVSGIKEGAKSGISPAGRDKKKEKSTVDCLNLVSKACFRKVPPSSFYLFFRPKSTTVEYSFSQASADKDVSNPFVRPFEGTQKGILHDKDLAFHTEPTPGKSAKVVGFGVGQGLQEQGKVKSDVSLGLSMKSDQPSQSGPQAKTLISSRKENRKPKRGPTELHENLKGASEGNLVDAPVSTLPGKGTDVKTHGKKKKRVAIKATSGASLVEEGRNTETIGKEVIESKKEGRGTKAKKSKKVSLPKKHKISSSVSAEPLPLPGNEIEQAHDSEADERALDLKHPDHTLQMMGSFDVDIAHDMDVLEVTEIDGLKVWKSGKTASASDLPVSASPTAELSPAVDALEPLERRSLDSAASSGSSGSSDSSKSKQLKAQVEDKVEQNEAETVIEHIDPTAALHKRPPIPVHSSSGLQAAPSFMIGFDPTGSFMASGAGIGMTRSSRSNTRITVEETPEVLQAVSSCTLQLIKTYNALVEDKSDEQWAPIRDLMTVMSYDELTRRRESYLEDETEEKLMDEQSGLDTENNPASPEGLHQDSSTQLLGSNVSTPSGSSVLSQKQSKLLPDNFSEKEFMKYFCSDWEQPPCYSASKPGPKKTVSSKKEVCKTVSEAIDIIDPDGTYDVIFTYKMPKPSPFDLNDSLADVRLKCVQKWMNDAVNATYRSYHDSEIKGKAEENLIKQLIEKMAAIQLKIKEYENVINMMPTCTLPTESSKSTFSEEEGSRCVDSEQVEEEQASEGIPRYPSDAQIESEIGVLMSKLEQHRPDDSEVQEKRLVESMDTGATEHVDEKSQSCHSMASSGSGSRCVATETRGRKRRREIREQLEKIIGMLEKKMNRLKNKIEKPHFDENYDEQENEKTDDVEPKIVEKSACNQPDTSQNSIYREDLLKKIDAKLKRDFLVGVEQQKEGKRAEGSPPEIQLVSGTVKEPSESMRLQLYLLGLSDTWHPQEDASFLALQRSDVKDERLLSSLKKEDIQAGIKHVKHQKRHIKYLPFEQQKTNVRPSADDEEQNRKLQLRGGNTLKMAGSHLSKHAKSRNTMDPQAKVPFTCKCLCDRVSRFNVKRKEHFRTVLNENLWCLRSNPELIRGNAPENKQPVQDTGAKTFCPAEEIDQPDNFKGWLADTDKNLLLLFNRSPLDRLGTDYYGHPKKEKHLPSHELEKEDSKTIRKNRIEETLKKLSEQEAEKIWAQAEQWYGNYKKCDKTRRLIEEFEKIDINAMMKRDLSMLQMELSENLKADKMKLGLHLELIYRRNFFENLKKLRDEYECSVRNRLAAKEKEMETRKEFTVQSTLRDMKDKFGPVKEEYKKRCIEWMAQIRDRTNATSQTVKQRHARELALMVEKMDLAERTRKNLVAASGKEHEEMEKTLGKAVEERDVAIEELDRKINNLTRDVEIWKRAVREVLNSFKKFMYYILETRPDRAQYFLSLEKLYQIQMDNMIREASEELEKVKTSEAKIPKDVELQPTMEIKCPSHAIRYHSEHSPRTGSSSDTDIDKDRRNATVVGHVVDAAIRGVLPTPEISVGGEDEDRIKDLEDLISRFAAEVSEEKVAGGFTTEDVCGEETMESLEVGPLVEDTSDPETPVEEFTRRRIRDLLKIITHRKPQIKRHIHL